MKLFYNQFAVHKLCCHFCSENMIYYIARLSCFSENFISLHRDLELSQLKSSPTKIEISRGHWIRVLKKESDGHGSKI